MKAPKKGSPQTPHHLIHRAGQVLDEVFLGHAKKLPAAGHCDLTARQFVVLGIVAKSGPQSQTYICDESGIDRSTLADIVRRMVDKGLLHRRRTREDARAYAVTLTDLGKRVLAEAQAAQEVTDAFILERLGSASAVKQFTAQLEKLKDRPTPEA